jgi:hypothetical protein
LGRRKKRGKGEEDECDEGDRMCIDILTLRHMRVFLLADDLDRLGVERLRLIIRMDVVQDSNIIMMGGGGL